MTSAANITFPGNLAQVATIVALRQIPSSLIADGALYSVSDPSTLFGYDTDSLAIDDGASVIRPNDRSPLQAGRWLISGSGVFDAGLRDALEQSGGSSLVGFTQAGTGAVTRTAQAKQRETVSVTDFGAKGDGATDDSAAINRAVQALSTLSAGSRLVFPRADYLCNDRILMTVPRMAVLLDGARISGTPWRYQGQQLPFGSFFYVTAADCSIEGTGMGNSVIQLQGGSEANGISFVHVGGGRVANLTLDGGKAQVTAVADDTFQTGINVLNASVSSASGAPSKALIDNVEARNWAQYGMQVYGDLARYVTLRRCLLTNNGIANQSISVGCGMAITRGIRDLTVDDCTVSDNKLYGFLGSSAGLDSSNISITGNTIAGNGGYAFSWTDEANFASVAGQGTNGLDLSGNTIANNAGGGVRFGTYDGVGYLRNANIDGGVIRNNGGFGVLIQTNAGADNRVSRVNVRALITGNSTNGLALGAGLDDTIRYDGTRIRGNIGADVLNVGDGRLIYNARGRGADIVRAATITIPADGDVFVLTGTAGTIDNIQPDQGRIIKLLFAVQATLSAAGNIVNGPLSANPNSAITLTSSGGGWYIDKVNPV